MEPMTTSEAFAAIKRGVDDSQLREILHAVYSEGFGDGEIAAQGTDG